MADNTISGTRGFEDVDQGGKIPHESEKGQGKLKTGVSTAKVGMMVSNNGESAGVYDLAITTDGSENEYLARPQNLDEITRNDPDWDIDTALPDVTPAIETYRKGCGAVVPMILEALAGPIAIQKNDVIVLGIEAGKIRKYAYTDAAVALDTLIEKVGVAEEISPGSAADDLILLVRMDS